MKRFLAIVSKLALAALVASGCGNGNLTGGEELSNPFLEGLDEGKEDTGYLNMRGLEVHVTLEADVTASSSWRLFDAPAEQAQFAVTYLRKRKSFYLEILAEDNATPDRVEWLVDGQWLDATAAHSVDRSKLTHYRLRQVNAVVMGSQANNLEAGRVFEAPVPLKPFAIMSDAGDKCADHNSHIDLSQGVYWYLWNPSRSGCPGDLLTTMTLTVEELLPNNPESYPEYDQLWADGELTAAVFFGKLDDGDVADDYNWRNVDRLADWLGEAGFSEQPDQPLGRRFVKEAVAERRVVIDIYGPDVFHSVADYARFGNWQKAVREHEIVMYNGHSVLGTGYAFERAEYPDFYQIFQVASCLSYEYYVRPVLAGKGDWASVDVISNVTPTYYSENFPLTTTVLAKLVWGFEHDGRASWQDIMEAVSRKVGHARFGVSGARGNCFSPEGDRCSPAGDEEFTFESTVPVDIPDNDQAGISSVIEAQGQGSVGSLEVELDITHTYVGDLTVTLTHAGKTAVLWNRQGGSADDIVTTLRLNDFNGVDIAGTWELHVVDSARYDQGRVNSWSLHVTSGSGEVVEPVRFASQQQLDIPDNDSHGVQSVISVPEQLTIASLQVEIDIQHTYVGDLVIELSHNGTSYALWDREGGSADDITRTFSVSAFDGQDAGGDWFLTISDNAGLDTGRLSGWALLVTPAQ